MLTQYQLLLQANPPSRCQPELGYRLYSSLLEEAPPSFARQVHEDGVSPVSQFVSRTEDGLLLWTVNLLGECSQKALGPVLEQKPDYLVRKDGTSWTVMRRWIHEIPDVEHLFEHAYSCNGRHQLTFVTATAFKSRGQYQNLPTPRLILQSLMKKWNGCFPQCPIEDEDGQGLDTMALGLSCTRFQLRDRLYSIKGNGIPGFCGTLCLQNRLSGFHRQLADVLLLFSSYAGVGIKTTLGMGGVRHTFLP